MPTPKFPKYPKNSLRPNPETADPSRGDLAFAQEQISVGHFGSWDADANVVNGLPPAEPAKAEDHGHEYSEPVGKTRAKRR